MVELLGILERIKPPLGIVAGGNATLADSLFKKPKNKCENDK